MQAWQSFLLHLEKELGSASVDKWLRPLKVLRYDAANLYLEASDPFQVLWFEEHVRQKAQIEFLNNNHRKIKIHLSVANAPAQPVKGKAKRTHPAPANDTPFKLTFDKLDPNCTFKTFIESPENRVAFKLLCEVCGYNPDTRQDTLPLPSNAPFNPIYLYGTKGTGKTHLLMAAAEALTARGLKVIYSRSESFTEHVVNAIRAGEMSTFRQSYRNIDVLLLDDVHVFSRKGATQEELFHTFNTLHLAGKQIILSANSAPQELQLIEPRLVSRFEWGIVLPLEQLSKPELLKVVQKKAEALNFPLNPKVGQFLIDSFESGTKSLSRALEALILRSHINNPSGNISSTSMTVAVAKHYLNDLIAEEEKQALTPQRIIQAVSEAYGVMSDEFMGKSQNRDSVVPRQLAMYFCRTSLNMPFMKIGDLFDRDHSTVMSSVKQIQKSLVEGDQEITSAVANISKKLTS